MKTRLLYLFALLLLLGCDANESEENKPEEPAELLCYPTLVTDQTTYIDGSKQTTERRYGYNDRGQLLWIKFFVNGTFASEYTYEYNSKGLIIRDNTLLANGELSDYSEYVYDAAGKVQSYNWYFYDSQQQKATFFRKYDLFYTSPTQLSSKLSYLEVDGELRQDLRNEYTYTNGQMTQVHTYNSNNELIRETTLTYDDKHNMLIGLERLRMLRVGDGFPHINNVVKKVVKDHQGEVIDYLSTSSVLEYNEKGYISGYTVRHEDGLQREAQITYNCPKIF